MSDTARAGPDTRVGKALDDRTVFEVAFDAAPCGIVVCEEAGTILFVNQQIARTFGYASADLFGRPIELLVPEAVAHAHAADRQGFWHHPESRPMGAGRELRGRRRDGTEVAVEVWLAVASREGQRLVVASVVDITERRQVKEQLRGALAEVRRLRERLARENVQLRHEVKALGVPRMLAAESAAARFVLTQIRQVAPTTATVLLQGETGSGKEMFAQIVHDLSPRQHRPMVRVNCAAIPAALLESELFGRERGAYTGALSRQIGRFELADGSTIFLDEVGDLPLEAQTKLLRVLQDK
jgi:PAS domain S-box-containing protein